MRSSSRCARVRLCCFQAAGHLRSCAVLCVRVYAQELKACGQEPITSEDISPQLQWAVTRVDTFDDDEEEEDVCLDQFVLPRPAEGTRTKVRYFRNVTIPVDTHQVGAIHTNTHSLTHTQTDTHAHRTRARTHTHARMHTHTHTRTHTLSLSLSHTHTHRYTRAQARTHTRTRTHTRETEKPTP